MMLLKNKTILVTGGAGYIGSHVVVQLLQAGAKVIVFDNLANAKRDVVKRIALVAGSEPEFVLGDVLDRIALRAVFERHNFYAVMHFAGLKAVGESAAHPLKYYENNVVGSVNLFQEMVQANVKKLIYSSSATVYGEPTVVKYTEDLPLNPVNVYGRTKLVVEDVLRDLKRSDPTWGIALLRYFNPVGAHESGLIGEDPEGVPNNLMPFIAQVAEGARDYLQIFGGDYPTHDGTGIRDYIHVEDLARGHIAALSALERLKDIQAFNLGTGRPYSVLEMVNTFSKVSGRPVPFKIGPRRVGDLAEYYADASFARHALGWAADHDIERMCRDVWRWQSQNKNIFD